MSRRLFNPLEARQAPNIFRENASAEQKAALLNAKLPRFGMGARASTGAGACSKRRRWILLLLLSTRSTCGVYWGEGWEDPVSKQLVNRALRVVSNDSSIPMEELTDFFDWLYFEEDGGVGKVKGNEGYEASSLQSWVPQHGRSATLAVP